MIQFYIYRSRAGMKEKTNLNYFMNFIHYNIVCYGKRILPHSSGEYSVAFVVVSIYILKEQQTRLNIHLISVK